MTTAEMNQKAMVAYQAIKKKRSELTKEQSELKDQQERLELWFQERLVELGTEKIEVGGYSVAPKSVTQVNVDDFQAYIKFILSVGGDIPTEMEHFLTKSARKESALTWADENDVMPDGLSTYVKQGVAIRKLTTKKPSRR